MKTVLLTGSAGYVGQNFIKNYKDVFNFVCVDRKEGKEVLKFKDFDNIDYIIHLAAISGIKNCENNVEQTIKDNVTSTIHLMENASKRKISMIFASSQGAKTPNNLYSITKRTCELTSYHLNKNNDSNIISLRFANIYGGYNYLDTKTSVVANFLNEKLNGRHVNINGNGKQVRDFVHVDDVCEIINRFLVTNVYPIHPVDVGTGIGTNINELAEMIGDNKPVYTENRNVGVDSNIAEVLPLSTHINYTPNYTKLQEYIDSILTNSSF